MDPVIAIPVEDASRVAEARRRAVKLAEGIGFDEAAAARVAIAATELATNLLRHAGRGRILVQAAWGGGLELISLDSGPGMASVDACLKDGYSTAGTQGNGLGAIQRQSSLLDIYSRPGLGTAILARFAPANAPAKPDRPVAVIGGISVAKPGEEACGDGWHAVQLDGALVVLVADGLGHGPLAATAAREAMRAFAERAVEPVPGLLAALHGALRPTRGAAVAVARLEAGRDRLAYGGVGNIAGAVLNGAAVRKMVSHNGTAGLTAPRLQEFTYEYAGGALLVMHSDGIGSSWTLDRYPGLSQRDPALIAGVIYRDFARGRDDATVVVARRAA